jgi:hypothetical protein
MPSPGDGLALVLLAEDVADLGAAGVMTDDRLSIVRDVAHDSETLKLVTARLGEEGAARAFLAGIIEMADHGEALDDDDTPRFVARAAALGTLLVSAGTEQPTGVFDALSA